MSTIIRCGGGYQDLDEMVQEASIAVNTNTSSADISAGEKGFLIYIVTGPSSTLNDPTASGTVNFKQVSKVDCGGNVGMQSHEVSSVTVFDGGANGGTIEFSGNNVWSNVMRKITQKQ